MIHRVIAPLVTILLYSHSSAFAAGRVMTVPLFAMQYAYLSVTNVSTVAQTLTIEFIATGGATVGQSFGITGGTAVICPSTHLCKNSNAHRVLAPGGNFTFGFTTAGVAGTVDAGNNGVSVKIAVEEDRGAIIANMLTQLIGPGYATSITVNGGRPF